MSDNHEHNNTELSESELAVAVPTICPTCGASRGGSAGGAHGCSTVATVASKSGTGVVYAPTANRCAYCGSKAHRNLPSHEQTIICLWQQFTVDTFGTTPTYTDKWGVETYFAPLIASHAAEFATWLASGKARVKVSRRGRPPTSKVATASVSVPAATHFCKKCGDNATAERFGEFYCSTCVVAVDVENIEAAKEQPKAPKKSKKQALAEALKAMD